jgi:hypothetical protein
MPTRMPTLEDLERDATAADFAYDDREDEPREPTRFEKEIDEVEHFDFRSLVSTPTLYREPLDVVCDICHAKHCHGHA